MMSNTRPGNTGRAPGAASQDAAPGPRGMAVQFSKLALALLAGILFAGFCALGTWQVKRLVWKLDLIERVEQRVHAPATDAPGPAAWASVTQQTDEYRHVRLSGTYLPIFNTLVQATTALGSGYWLVTPLRTADGSTVLVNRGFVPKRENIGASTPAGTVSIDGLLRISETGGGFLRENSPATQHWYSRDVAAIAKSHMLSNVAPYFVDAKEKSETAPDAPVGGLTVISFHNSHLVYALTWFALALMVAGISWWIVRDARKRRAFGKHLDNAQESDHAGED
ncbi:SURF1 family protein [Janthinobacterium sp. HLX7-2]|uniref:SURF1 family protein n=1 Tax=Janthinobacterium sp. HLX7-2 TaxID=1259331 RepID=UPI003F1EA4EC